MREREKDEEQSDDGKEYLATFVFFRKSPKQYNTYIFM